MAHILAVDDEASVRRILKRILESNNYTCTLASNALEARSFIKDQIFDLVICDLNMPGESGMELIQYIIADDPGMAVIMLTAVSDPDIAKTALEMGAYGYILKPFKNDELIININNALLRRKLEIQNRLYSENLERLVNERTEELNKTLHKFRKTLEGIVLAMAMTVESRDPYTAGHQRRVAELARAIGNEMEFSESQLDGLYLAGIIHDLGKIAVPAEILVKPGKITDVEFEMIKTHCRVGYDILKEIDFPWPLAQIVHQHHEKTDGSGYPYGYMDDNILLEARILTVADVVEAMASHRPYRPALGIDIALEEISQKKNIQYDADAVEACLKVFAKNKFEFQ